MLKDLEKKGYDDIINIPKTYDLNNELRSRVHLSVIENKEYIGDDLGEALNEAVYPIYYLDFETFGTGIPLLKDSKPYEAIPFQWSIHILDNSGNLEHKEFLSSDNTDPREELTQSLIESLGLSGSICTYSSYEKRVLNGLIKRLPGYNQALTAFIERLWDLEKVISKHYYHPKFNGSFSMKSVLPVLAPDLSYKDLGIQDGIQASIEYLRMVNDSTEETEKNKISKDLREYCGQDSLGMYAVHKVLANKVGQKI